LKSKDYAVYKGDTLICFGTLKECAKHLGVLPETVKFYTTPTYKKRRKNSTNDHLIVFRIEDD
jgi:hypothetical protein